ncbi:MAG: YihY/virulence factor BrkB family protein [Lachnospiraceae bacterium]|nr:YihY/virulence factor BrkB family protein [Lachnospiraceae bacterium]
MWKKIVRIAADFSKQISRENIAAYASSTAFFMFLSLIPLIMVLCSMIPFTVLTEQDLIQVIKQMIPDVVGALLVSIIEDVYDRATGVVSVALLITLWSAGKGMLAIIRGLNEITESKERRNYFVLRIVASAYTLLMLSAVVVALVAMVFGNSLLELVLGYYPMAKEVVDVIQHFRFLVSWGVLTLLFAVIYTFVPSDRQKFWYQFPGAIFSAVVWSVFSYAFSIYIQCFNGFSTYGSLTTIIIILLWLYFCFYIIMIGAFLNQYFMPAYEVFSKKRHEKRQLPQS